MATQNKQKFTSKFQALKGQLKIGEIFNNFLLNQPMIFVFMTFSVSFRNQLFMKKLLTGADGDYAIKISRS